ncbi:MAG: 50S ribosomal protein L22 [Candidatus Zambryskibacteria bacterium RIFCSPHIGHO2_01_FULL_49_18]|uniref:Large ribosomal subunit protein uL22 n=2 Tax=Candidatus Zambryskiibacteriota TaxID=1817925 RepID=A0A1G2T4Y9_9BACT|nr:MAG: 50S ribosomal protein L22 [Candidatus Zambryskibacteria bacterium RIFCSPHIGHO2_01_FULL_49_18]OHB05634.1 MAG: 50S ribosomal protein L22 [Candidatus Zambryskibacteria bacterium RIFCSPLOWO2_01_FULL_47_14]
MNNSKATLNTYRQSPRKVRLVADTVRGKKVSDALDLLAFIPKRAGEPLRKLIASAHANSGKEESLFIKEIKVDAGPTLYRRRPRSRGMANPIRKRTSHITVILSEANKAKKLES